METPSIRAAADSSIRESESVIGTTFTPNSIVEDERKGNRVGGT